MPASMANLMYPATLAAMLVTQREPFERPLDGATPTDSLCPSKDFPAPDVKEEPRAARAGAAACGRAARVCFTPTAGALRPTVTLPIRAAIVDAVLVTNLRHRQHSGKVAPRDADERAFIAAYPLRNGLPWFPNN